MFNPVNIPLASFLHVYLHRNFNSICSTVFSKNSFGNPLTSFMVFDTLTILILSIQGTSLRKLYQLLHKGHVDTFDGSFAY